MPAARRKHPDAYLTGGLAAPGAGGITRHRRASIPATDDYDLRFCDCDSSYEKRGAQTRQIKYFQIGHYMGYDLVGRTEVEPMPIDPDFKKTGRYWLFGLYPILSPDEIRGTGFIRWRYADPRKADDIWSLNAGSRRVRRLNEAIMSDATASGTSAHAWDPDHYSGFNAKTEEYNYRFLGEKNILGSIHAIHSPEVPCPTDGGTSACPEAWEMRHLYIVQATPRRGHVNALDSRTIIYLNSEMWFEPYIDTYDRAGRLFRSHIYWLATMCYLPGRETPEHECWYINMGAVDKTNFTTDAMARAANF